MKLRAAVAALAMLTTSACASSVVGADHDTSNAALFEQLWSQVDLHYSFFELKRINWDSLHTAFLPRAIGAANEQELARVFGHLLWELRDPHVALTPFGAGSTVRYLGRSDTSHTFFSASGVHDHYMPAQQFNSADLVRAAMITDSVGYLHIANFRGNGLSASVDSALATLAAAQSLIVDVRDNGGGTYALAVDIAGRFVAKKQTFGFLQFRNGIKHSDFSASAAEMVVPSGVSQLRGPIYLLTNGRTVSSAEVFVLALRTNPLVTVVGDTTAGASGGPTARELSNGWVFELSEWIEYTPEHRTYEGVGLVPDAVIKPVASDVARKIDPVLERALLLATHGTLSRAGTLPVLPGPQFGAVADGVERR